MTHLLTPTFNKNSSDQINTALKLIYDGAVVRFLYILLFSNKCESQRSRFKIIV